MFFLEKLRFSISIFFLIIRIREKAEPFGLCKIVPPSDWDPKCEVKINQEGRFSTKLQKINTLQQGQGFDDGKQYTLKEYKEMADNFYNSWSQKYYDGKRMTVDQLENDYWDMVETNNKAAVVEYGNDIDTTKYKSGFPKASYFDDSYLSDLHENSNTYLSSPWNLNNIAKYKGSILRYLKAPINGINVPWLYVGMLFASFCWHNEDNYFYSINYSHYGAEKQWYGVPGDSADLFEKVFFVFISLRRIFFRFIKFKCLFIGF